MNAKVLAIVGDKMGTEGRGPEGVREIPTSRVVSVVRELCIETNCVIREDVLEALKECLSREESSVGVGVLSDLVENARVAMETMRPICQDTGMVVAFIRLGQDVRIIGGNLYEAVNEGVRQGYEQGYLRKSVVADPFTRRNTNDNTPAVIHVEITSGSDFEITIMPKGFGSENMSRLAMLNPAEGISGVEDFVVDTVARAGGNPCPPVIVGVGVGGTMEKAGLLAKRALLRPVTIRHENRDIEALEERLLARINDLGIGPGGLGGRVTALAVNVEVFPTHIAGLPVAVNICCHAARHGTRVLR